MGMTATRTSRHGGRRGFTLVEVLIATLVLVMVVVPLVGLLTSGKTDQQSEEGMSEAVAFCQEMMEKLLSNNLPFEAIDPGGGATLTKAVGGTPQAGFKPSTAVRGQTFTGAELEKLLADKTVGTDRVKEVKRKQYRVYFFAGRYPDGAPVPDTRESPFRRPDMDNTLSFSYLEKPAGYGQPYNFREGDRTKFNRQTILGDAQVSLGNIEASPYELRSYTVAGGANPIAENVNRQTPYFYHDLTRIFPDKPGQAVMVGWPDPREVPGGFTGAFSYNLNDGAGQQRDLWAAHLKQVATGGKAPTLAYHPMVIDQRTFKATNGALMKIILGVKFAPYENSALRKDTGDNMREFWLCSFKANLED